MIKHIRIVLLFLSSLIFTASAGHAQPFGIGMDTPLNELNVDESRELNDINRYYLSSVPRSHNEFEEYVVTLGETTGVCSILANGKIYNNDAYGTGVKRAFDSIRSQLESGYGSSQLASGMREKGGIWASEDNWVFAIRQNERVHEALWLAQTGATMKDNVAAIKLQVLALTRNSAFLQISYQFDNFAKCYEENRASQADAL